MEINLHTRLQVRVQNTTFIFLILVIFGLLAWLSTLYKTEIDWTFNRSNSLSSASEQLLDKFSKPIEITVYVSSKNKQGRQDIEELITRYQRYKTDIQLQFIDPYRMPVTVRELGIQVDGEIVIHYQDRTEHIRKLPQQLMEQDITAALHRIVREDNRTLLFLTGHGERSPEHFDDPNLGQWAEVLKSQGFAVDILNLIKTPNIPENTGLLIIASPRKQLLPGEITAVEDYLQQGGNLLWLIDEDALYGLEPIAQQLGFTVQPGILLDATSQAFGINANFVSITTQGYATHPVTENAEELLTAFFQAKGIQVTETTQNWDATDLLTTMPQVWSETGGLEGTIQYDEGTDIDGPLVIATAFSRLIESPLATPTTTTESLTIPTEAPSSEEEAPSLEQRVIVVGDGDFIANAFVGYAGNLDLSTKMINWLVQDDDLIDIPPKTAMDLSFTLSPDTAIILGALFLFVLPLALVSIGISIWLQRRKA